jgi:hypothetical protein
MDRATIPGYDDEDAADNGWPIGSAVAYPSGTFEFEDGRCAEVWFVKPWGTASYGLHEASDASHIDACLTCPCAAYAPVPGTGVTPAPCGCGHPAWHHGHPAGHRLTSDTLAHPCRACPCPTFQWNKRPGATYKAKDMQCVCGHPSGSHV